MNIKELLQIKDVSRQEIEVIFRTSSSSDELFDAFRIAINSHIKDPEFYKTLLWNKALSTDEIAMFAEKICKEYPETSYSIYFAVGQIYSSISFYGRHLEKAFTYYRKAAEAKPEMSDPYLAVLKMYSKELDVPRLEDIMAFVQPAIEKTESRSYLCFEISAFFKKIGNKEKERTFRKLGEKYQKEEE